MGIASVLKEQVHKSLHSRHIFVFFALPKLAKFLIFMAPEVGLEPTTLRLTAECSAIELLRIASRSTFGGALR